MDIFPISLKLQQQPCLIVGGDYIQLIVKRCYWLKCAKIDVLAPEIDDSLLQLVQQSQGQYVQDVFSSSTALRHYRLVIAATDNNRVNQQVFAACEAENVLVNSVDDPPHCRFMVPAIIDRSPLVISVASNGTSPALSRQIRTQLESSIPHGMGKLAIEFSGQWRAAVKQKIVNPEERRIFGRIYMLALLKNSVPNDNLDAANQSIQHALMNGNAKRRGVFGWCRAR